MQNLQSLIDHIFTTTGLSTGWAREKEIDLTDITAPVTVYVGYHSVEANGVLGDGETGDPYQNFAEDLTQYAVVQFACPVAEFHTYWKTIYNACAGWIPVAAERDYSGFMHSGGGAMGLRNGRIWWLDKWRIDFPRK